MPDLITEEHRPCINPTQGVVYCIFDGDDWPCEARLAEWRAFQNDSLEIPNA